MLKRALDIVVAAAGLIVFSPIILPVMFLIWRQDGFSPFYIAPRTGKNETPFNMVKLRSMIKHADKSGVDSTGANDQRITPVGQFVRRYKLDEISQLWNVLIGDMSLTGPRPNVKRETDLYSPVEKKLLSVKPGITDIASIVFSDEGDILKDKIDPDLAYNQLIRPYKGHLGLFYIDNQSLTLDLQLLWLTAIAILSRPAALRGIQRILENLNARDDLKRVALRKDPLQPAPPPGLDAIVTTR